jgi:predicted ATPase
VGRGRELEAIGGLLRRREARVLTGPGGVGKTRLALEAAWEANGLFPDGVIFVALASLGDAAPVLPTIAQSLGLRESGGHGTVSAFRGRCPTDL